VELGFRAGQLIERDVFERLYGQFIDPRDPSGQARLGRAPQQFRSADQIYAVLGGVGAGGDRGAAGAADD
jgi:hypothetical protein